MYLSWDAAQDLSFSYQAVFCVYKLRGIPLHKRKCHSCSFTHSLLIRTDAISFEKSNLVPIKLSAPYLFLFNYVIYVTH